MNIARCKVGGDDRFQQDHNWVKGRQGRYCTRCSKTYSQLEAEAQAAHDAAMSDMRKILSSSK